MPDFIRLKGGPWDGQNRITPVWPPPEVMQMEGGEYRQQRRSQLTDEDMEAMPNVGRGAEYEWEPAVELEQGEQRA